MIDLHLHLDGSLTPEDIITIANHDGTALPTTDLSQLKSMLTAPQDCDSLLQYLKTFELPLLVLQTEYSIEYAVYSLLSRLNSQGICYSEIRFAPQLHTTRELTQEQVVNSAIKGLEKAQNNLDITANLILCLMRNGNHQQNKTTVDVAKKYFGQGVCAIDLAGDEARYPTSLFSEFFKTARDYNIPFTIHAGEAADYTSVKTALNFGASRIGHGTKSINDTELLHHLKEQNIPLEMCLTSNLQTKAVANTSQFPFKNFCELGVAVTINTDNLTVSDTTLKNEYCKVKNLYGFSNAQMQQFCVNSAKFAFLNSNKKQKLIKKISLEFMSWIKEK